MLWVENGLVNKLVANQVAEKQWNNITFTKSFSAFVIECINNRVPMHTLEQCRKVFCRYDRGLGRMTNNEVRAIMVLLGFYLDRLEKRVPHGR